MWDFIHNFYSDLNEHQTRHTKVIIVGTNEPSSDIEFILEDLELSEKVCYLRCSILESSFFDRTNIRKAKAAYVFVDPTDEDKVVDQETNLYLFIKDLNFMAPNVDIVLFHGRAVKNKKLQFKIKEELFANNMKNLILGTMVMNKGA